ncbi:hypothetical protein [Pseudomonas syringae]|nr:hypothetical protein [Pseudomonas syringae]
MIHGTGNVKVLLAGQDDAVEFEEIEFTFSEGETKTYIGADNSQVLTNKSGTIGFKSQPFKKWAEAEVITLIFNDGKHHHHTFEVTKTIRRPYEDEGWLYYPVLSLRAQLYGED